MSMKPFVYRVVNWTLITLFRSIIVLCRIIFTFSLNETIFHRILLIPQRIVMDMNNVMPLKTPKHPVIGV